MRKHLHPAAALLGATLAAGCSTPAPPTSLTAIQVVGEVGANTNSATAIDLVFVYDSKVLGLLPDKGPDWFDKKDALTKALATSIDVVALGVPPATLSSVALPVRYREAIGVYSYANYLSAAGQPKCNLTPYQQMVIWLTPDTVFCSGK